MRLLAARLPKPREETSHPILGAHAHDSSRFIRFEPKTLMRYSRFVERPGSSVEIPEWVEIARSHVRR